MLAPSTHPQVPRDWIEDDLALAVVNDVPCPSARAHALHRRLGQGPKTGISDVGDSYPRGMTSSGSISATLTFIAAMVFATVA